MKKRIIILIGLVYLLTGCVSTSKKIDNKVPEYIEELEQLGYSSNTIEVLQERLDPEVLKVITGYDYVDVI